MALATAVLVLITAAAKLMMRVCINCNNKKCINGSKRLRMMFTRKSKELNLILSSLLSAICTSYAYQIFNFVVNMNFFLFFQCWSSKLEKKRAFLSIMLKLTHKIVDNQTTSIPPLKNSKTENIKNRKKQQEFGNYQ